MMTWRTAFLKIFFECDTQVDPANTETCQDPRGLTRLVELEP